MRSYGVFIGCAMLGVLSLTQAEPPRPLPFLRAPVVDGRKQFPLKYGVNSKDHQQRILMMNPYADTILAFAQRSENDVILQLEVDAPISGGSNANAIQDWRWKVRPLDVFPFFSQCYLVTKVSGSKQSVYVELRNVTESLPVKLRPTSDRRTICMTSYQPQLFWNGGGAASSQMQFEVADYLRKTSLGVL